MNNDSMFTVVFREVAKVAAHPAVQYGIIAVTALASASAVMENPRNQDQPALPEPVH